jgi:hypothetical protein
MVDLLNDAFRQHVGEGGLIRKALLDGFELDDEDFGRLAAGLYERVVHRVDSICSERLDRVVAKATEAKAAPSADDDAIRELRASIKGLQHRADRHQEHLGALQTKVSKLAGG